MSWLRAAGSISGLTLVSRVLGLVRDSIMFGALGTGAVTGVFVFAWMIPNALRRLFGEGALSAAFLPVYTRRLEQDGPDAAKATLAGVSGALVFGLASLVAIALATAWLLPPDAWQLEAKDGLDSTERGELLRRMLTILLPYSVPVCLLAIWSGAANAHRIFAPGAAAPIVLNVFWIVGLLAFVGEDPQTIAIGTAACLTLAGLVQLVLVAIPLMRRRALPFPSAPRREHQTRDVFVAMGPTALGLSIVQVNLLADQVFAEYLVGPGSNSFVYLANRLLLFPHALVALPLATAVFPQLASNASRDDFTGVRRSLDSAISWTTFMSLPAAVGLILIAEPFTKTFYEHGAMTAADTVVTANTTAALVVGLPAIGVSQLCARALYATGQTMAPARIAAKLLVLNIVLNAVFVSVFELGVAGLTAATSACSWINAILLRRATVKLAPGPALPWRSFGNSVLATAAMALATFAVMPSAWPEARWEIGWSGLALPIAAGIVTYAAVHAALRTPELGRLLTRLGRTRGSNPPPA